MFEFESLFWSFFCFLIGLLLVALVIIGLVNPCLLGHVDAYLGQEYCDVCGVQLRPFCPLCLTSCHPSSTFCSTCGSVLFWDALDQEVIGNE